MKSSAQILKISGTDDIACFHCNVNIVSIYNPNSIGIEGGTFNPHTNHWIDASANKTQIIYHILELRKHLFNQISNLYITSIKTRNTEGKI